MLQMHFGCAKMHLMRTFCFAKMHFCTNKMLQMHFMRTFCWCKNAFDAKMHFGCAKMHFCITFSKGKCSAKQNVTNAFDATRESGKMHFGVHFLKENVQRTFDFVKCDAKQNVTNAFDAKMHFGCAKMHLMLPAKAAKCI